MGIGFLVGFAVRIAGKGVTSTYGVIGAIFALLGCLLGNVLSICGFIETDGEVGYLGVVLTFLTNPPALFALVRDTFSPMDLLFYGIAVYEGYKFSFRELTAADLDRLT